MHSTDIPKFKPNPKYKSPNHYLNHQNTKVAYTKQNTKSYINPLLTHNPTNNQTHMPYQCLPQKPINYIKVHDCDQINPTNHNTMSSINFELERKNMFDYTEALPNGKTPEDIVTSTEDYNPIKTQPTEPYHQKTLQSSCTNDLRLEYSLNALSLDCYLKPLKENKINFDDLFLLTREDMKEMNIPIGPRNRLLSFMRDYKEVDRKYTIEDLKEFFNINQEKFLGDHCSMTNICMTEETLGNNQQHQQQLRSSADIKVNQVKKERKERECDSPNYHLRNLNISSCYKTKEKDIDKKRNTKPKELCLDSNTMYQKKRILSNDFNQFPQSVGVSNINYGQCHTLMSPSPNKKRPQMIMINNPQDYKLNKKEKSSREKHLVLSDNNRLNKPLLNTTSTITNNNIINYAGNRRRNMYSTNSNSHNNTNNNNTGELNRLMKMENLLKKQLKECSISISEKRLVRLSSSYNLI